MFHLPLPSLHWFQRSRDGLRAGAILTGLLLLTVNTGLAVDPTDLDLVYGRTDRLADLSITADERKALSASLMDDARWSAKTWNLISSLAVQARFHGDAPKPEPETKKKDALALPEKVDAAGKSREEAFRAACEARAQLGKVLRALLQIEDKRLPRLIGPLLQEHEADLTDDDVALAPAQGLAAEILSAFLADSDQRTDLPPAGDEEKWRAWWEENKNTFGPVLKVGTKVPEPAEAEAPRQPKPSNEPDPDVVIGPPRATPKRPATSRPAPVATPAPTPARKPVIRAVPIDKQPRR